MARLTFRVPAELARFVAVKGSVAIDGVSLTVNEVAGTTFTVLIIPHTLEVTTIGALATGDEVNFEVDLMARYAARLMERHGKYARMLPRVSSICSFMRAARQRQ